MSRSGQGPMLTLEVPGSGGGVLTLEVPSREWHWGPEWAGIYTFVNQ